MSTLMYAALTTRREESHPGTSTTSSAPGIRTYADAFAALVPAEVLTLHALIISFTTNTENATTKITSIAVLQWSFYALAALSMILYVTSRLQNGKWDRLDYVRMLIPPLSFVGWTMIQKATAFDALKVDISESSRTVISLFTGVLLGVLASSLSFRADQKNPAISN
ncbi:MAG: hypothetical protein JST75_09210 [Bacteroidetes bacterium]|nr:hypothetical protein [Bacteroidota bacterium]